MNTTRRILLIIILTFGINAINGNILKLPNSLEVSVVDNAMVNIIENCFPEVHNIFFCGQHNATTIKTIISLNKFATVQLEQLSFVKKINYNQKKIDLMIVNNYQLENFSSTLKDCNRLKTPTNQIMVFMICREEEISETLLINFSALWDCRFFIVYALCLNSENDLKIYTFNPFTNRTAFMWEKVELLSNFSMRTLGDRWTLHCRPYQKENICRGFKFDRTKYLDGVEVFGKMNTDSTSSLSETEEMIKKAINMSITTTSNRRKRYKPNEIFRTYDISLTVYSRELNYSSYSHNYYSYETFSQPLSYYSMKILTHNRGVLTPLEKIYNYYGYLTVFSTVVILVITFIVVYFSEHDFTFAVFEILRLLINAGIKTRIDTGKSRIFFSMIFFYFLIIHGTFSGRLAGFLTKAEYRKNAETLEDLEDPHYKIITSHPLIMIPLRHNSILKNKYHLYVWPCESFDRNNHSVSCIDKDFRILPMVSSEKLHVSKRSLLYRYDAFVMRNNWPLASRVNDVAIWGLHSGLSYKWTRDKLAKDVRRIETLKARSFVPYRPVVFEDLMFSFILLGIGLSLSMICFIIEILIKKKKNKRQRRVKQVHIQRWISTALLQLKIEVPFRKFVHYLRCKK